MSDQEIKPLLQMSAGLKFGTNLVPDQVPTQAVNTIPTGAVNTPAVQPLGETYVPTEVKADGVAKVTISTARDPLCEMTLEEKVIAVDSDGGKHIGDLIRRMDAAEARLTVLESEFVTKVKHAFSQIGVDVKKLFGKAN